MRVLVVVFGCALGLACTHAPVARSGTKAPPPARHAQIFRALTNPERAKVADELRARNSPAWRVGGEEDGHGAADVDRFRGLVRRAFRRDPPKGAISAPPSEEEAAATAQAFVKKNADLLGIPLKELIDLDTKALPLAPSVQPTPATHWMTRVSGSFPTRGYEAFREIESTVDVWIYVDDDRETRFFVNFSQVHAGLSIDTHPSGDDATTASKLVGRRVFALESPIGQSEARDDPSRPLPSVRALRRIPLGTIAAPDVKRRDLMIHVSEGPLQAWLVYRLAYKVQVEKRDAAGTFFYFWYVVDADTGVVLEDAVPPLVTPPFPP
jgi:hypothetical protein